jgi:hypothetical protein
MSGSEQDNSSGTGSTNPVVRLRGFPKKTADPPPSTPVIPPKASNAPAGVRFKRRATSQPTGEDVSPPAVVPPLVEESVLADSVDPVEYPGETAEPYREYPLEPVDQTYQEPVQDYSAEPSGQAGQEPFEAAPVEQVEQTCQEPFEEVPVEQYRAYEAPVEPPQGGTTDSRAAASFQEAVPKSPDPPVAANPSAAGVRVRMPPKTAPATTEAPAAWDAVGQTGTRPEGSSAAPAGLPYKPDTDLDRIYRRQWWKHDLKVKAGLWTGEEAQKES